MYRVVSAGRHEFGATFGQFAVARAGCVMDPRADEVALGTEGQAVKV